jgi:hypothetical protein
MEPERRCKSGMDGGLRAAVLFSPPLHLRMDDFLSNRWGPPQHIHCAIPAGGLSPDHKADLETIERFETALKLHRAIDGCF